MLIDLTIFKLNIFWNSPYSPKYNPIEEVFGVLKSKLKKRDIRYGLSSVFSLLHVYIHPALLLAYASQLLAPKYLVHTVGPLQNLLEFLIALLKQSKAMTLLQS